MFNYVPRVGDRVVFITHGFREEMLIEQVGSTYIKGSGKTTIPSMVVEVIERAGD